MFPLKTTSNGKSVMEADGFFSLPCRKNIFSHTIPNLVSRLSHFKQIKHIVNVCQAKLNSASFRGLGAKDTDFPTAIIFYQNKAIVLQRFEVHARNPFLK